MVVSTVCGWSIYSTIINICSVIVLQSFAKIIPQLIHCGQFCNKNHLWKPQGWRRYTLWVSMILLKPPVYLVNYKLYEVMRVETSCGWPLIRVLEIFVEMWSWRDKTSNWHSSQHQVWPSLPAHPGHGSHQHPEPGESVFDSIFCTVATYIVVFFCRF